MGGAREGPDSLGGDEPAGVLPGRILVADDEHLVATILTEYLKHMGMEVVGPARNGAEAIELARRHGADMALLDIRMPGMDGLEAADILYHQLGIPVVIASAFSDPEYLHKGAKVGVFGYLLKPVSAEELRASLSVAWSRFVQQVRLKGELDELKAALENRKLVERAKGLLMDNLKLGETDAMRRLQKQARDTRQKLHEVARSILENERLILETEGQPENGDRSPKKVV